VSYLGTVYNPKEYRRLVERVVKRVEKLKSKLKFDTIAFRGSSGAALAYPVASRLGLRLAHVHKTGTHACRAGDVEGAENVRRYLIIDDFVESGKTLNKIVRAIDAWYGQKTTLCVGVLLYNESKDWREKKHLIDKATGYAHIEVL
jgi:adenine/guanine phosphoribosyltransferase-like PRPP-binding protein